MTTRSPGFSYRSRPFISQLLVTLWAVLLLTGGCTLRLIGDYDDVIDRGITDFQQKIESRFTKLETAPETPYDPAFYDELHAQLATLQSRARASAKKEILVKQLDDLKANVDNFQKADSKVGRDAGKMNPHFVADARQLIVVQVEAILKLELALKRGENPKQ